MPDPPDDVVELATDRRAVAVVDDPAAVRHHAAYVLGGGREDDGVLVPSRARGARGCGVEHDQVGPLSDGDRARVVPAERRVAVGGRRRQQLGGRPVATLLGGEPLVELDRAHLLEEVDHGVAVGAQREPGTGVVQPARRADAVAEVALGGRAERRVRTRSADQGDVVVGEVGGVHERRRRAEDTVVGEQPRRRDAVRLEAAVVLGDLLGEVDVQRAVAGPAATSSSSVRGPRGRSGPRHRPRCAGEVDASRDRRPARSRRPPTRRCSAPARPRARRRSRTRGRACRAA